MDLKTDSQKVYKNQTPTWDNEAEYLKTNSEVRQGIRASDMDFGCCETQRVRFPIAKAERLHTSRLANHHRGERHRNKKHGLQTATTRYCQGLTDRRRGVSWGSYRAEVLQLILGWWSLVISRMWASVGHHTSDYCCWCVAFGAALLEWLAHAYTGLPLDSVDIRLLRRELGGQHAFYLAPATKKNRYP